MSFSLKKSSPHLKAVIAIGFVVLLAALVIPYIATTFRETTVVTIRGSAYKLWLADNEAERVQGLSGVAELPHDGGLLMVFDTEDRWGIWMKDMKIPLDILWLNSQKEVVYVVTDASPDLGTSTTFASTDPALYVIELPAGSVKQAAIHTGDLVDFTLPEAKE